jgi:hypothetical protein
LPSACPSPRAHFRRLTSLPAELRDLAAYHANDRLDHIDAALHADSEIGRLRAVTPPDPRLKAHAEERIAALTAEAERHRADADAAERRAAPLRGRASAAGELVQRLIAFVAQAPAGSLRPVKPPPIPPGATLESVRGQIADLARQAEAARLAPRPRAQVVAMLQAEVDALAAKGAPKIDARRPHAPARLADHLRPDPGDFLVWLHRDQIVERLAREVPDLPDALDDAQRAARLADLAARRLKAERLEETLCRAAEAEGRQIDRRPGADPRAVLGLDRGAP